MTIPVRYIEQALTDDQQKRGLKVKSVISQECIDARLQEGRPPVPDNILSDAIWLMQLDGVKTLTIQE